MFLAAFAAGWLRLSAAECEQVKMDSVNVPGATCGKDKKAQIYYLQSNGSQPLIAFSHGLGAGGTPEQAIYGKLLCVIASKGFVVIALDAGTKNTCFTEDKDQLLALQYAANDWKGRSRIDNASQAGIIGHSMGG